MNWRAWFRESPAPHRSLVITAIQQLPALPEADRMTTKPKQRARVKTVEDWHQRYGSWGERKRA